MTRPLRVVIPGGVYHLMARGNRQSPIFTDDEDRLQFLDFLTTVTTRYHWLCHAYGLMSNHDPA